MFWRQAFFEWYTGEWVDEKAFTEAESNSNKPMTEFEQYQEPTPKTKKEFLLFFSQHYN